MCGIFALLNNNDKKVGRTFLSEQFMKGEHRGPEYSHIESTMIKLLFGFHRLAINGLNVNSHQPIKIDNVALICNGEIYNYNELYESMCVSPETQSDCEVIIHLYLKYGIEHTLQMLDGVFAFCLVDYRLSEESPKLYVARDPYGVRPLYALSRPRNDTTGESVFAFASELKQLVHVRDKFNALSTTTTIPSKQLLSRKKKKKPYTITHFQPGTYSCFELPSGLNCAWIPIANNAVYHTPGFQSCIANKDISMDEILRNIQTYLQSAVYKRCSTTERPIACLLSGGLDSSLIAALVNEYHITNKLPTIETYSIGLAGSPDLHYAKMVADHLGTKHTEVVLTEEDFLQAIPEVIYDIESYDTTTVRASIGNWLLGKYISNNSSAKVIFNGDGADELAGGYLYTGCAPDTIEFDKECRRLLKDIHKFDVLRSDKSISSHGLEPRTPFLDREWTQYYLSIPLRYRFHSAGGHVEKYLIRHAFSREHFMNSNQDTLLPEQTLWRRKEAFSDGVSKETRSLYTIVQEFACKALRDILTEDGTDIMADEVHYKPHLYPQDDEQCYYRKIFDSYFSYCEEILPYFWMPKYIAAKDSSARTLKIYHT